MSDNSVTLGRKVKVYLDDITAVVPNTCENCKAYIKYGIYDGSYCNNYVIISYDNPKPNFSCSLHEAK